MLICPSPPPPNQAQKKIQLVDFGCRGQFIGRLHGGRGGEESSCTLDLFCRARLCALEQGQVFRLMGEVKKSDGWEELSGRKS